jgi:DNA-binding NarL/FixJ family response regulator
VRLVIADDHPIFREGLRKLLESQGGFSVVGEASDGSEAARLAGALRPDLMLLDLAMPRAGGLDALRELAEGSGSTRILLLTAAITRAQIVEALQLGARGVVLKESATQLLFKAIRAVVGDQYWVGRECVSDLVRYLRDQTPARSPERNRFGLTPRELQVVGAVVAGYANKDIAKRFSVSEDTVKHHLSHIFDKVGVSNRLELALFAINHELVDRDEVS